MLGRILAYYTRAGGILVLFAGYDTPSFISCSFFSLIQQHTRVFEFGFLRADSPFPEHYFTPAADTRKKKINCMQISSRMGNWKANDRSLLALPSMNDQIFQKEEPLLFFWERSVLYVPTLPTLSLLLLPI